MPGDAAREKRVRRRVTARRWDFFVSVSPGLETVCRDECAAFPFLESPPAVVEGGVGFSGRPHVAFQANLHTRTANRILMRLDECRVSNFRRLEKRLEGFDWDLFLKPGCFIRVKVSSSKSRLYHTGAVRERVAGVLGNSGFRVDSVGATADGVAQTLYVRIVEDRLTVSLDSSGDILYKRGLKTHGGKAPLRETTAAAALMLAGYTGREPLVDPMCGSGTFALEAAMIARNVPAGMFRKFAFFDWPCFSPSRWRHFRAMAEQEFGPDAGPLVHASDIDPEACRALRDCVTGTCFEKTVEVKEGVDFFDLHPKALTGGCGAVVLNPPYGLRMDPSKKDVSSFFAEIFRKLKKDYRGWKAAVVAPVAASASAPPEMKKTRLFHGGLDLFLLYGKIGG